jgi:hypothetical protein
VIRQAQDLEEHRDLQDRLMLQPEPTRDAARRLFGINVYVSSQIALQPVLRMQQQKLRTRRAGGVMVNHEGARRLAIAVLQQAVADFQSPIPEYRQSAAAFMERPEDFDRFWCALVGLDGDAVRERLSEQVRQHQEAA